MATMCKSTATFNSERALGIHRKTCHHAAVGIGSVLQKRKRKPTEQASASKIQRVDSDIIEGRNPDEDAEYLQTSDRAEIGISSLDSDVPVRASYAL